MKHKLALLIKFCTVGIGNTLIDFIVFFLLVRLGFPYLLSQLVAFMVGMMNSFIWNRLWTFQVRQKVEITEMVRFMVINIAALVTTSSVLMILSEEMKWPLLWSKGVATIAGIGITFLGSKFWVFKETIRKHKLQEN